MKWGFLWFFLLLQAPLIQAQTRRISGVVLDGTRITLLPGVRISNNLNETIGVSDSSGHFSVNVPNSPVELRFILSGYHTIQRSYSTLNNFSPIFLYKSGSSGTKERVLQDSLFIKEGVHKNLNIPVTVKAHEDETYQELRESPFEDAAIYPFSSFMLNANDAAYCNVRRFIMAKELPPREAVRIEEMTNYFTYHDKSATSKVHPMNFRTNITTCPWHPGNLLMRVAVNVMKLPEDTVIPNNLVLLIDISGSMDRPNKLPLLKTAFDQLVDQMDSSDKIAVVAYAGDVTIVLPSTSCKEKDKILNAINNLDAGGSTAGGAGIEKAFKYAKNNFIKDGNNRIILATDGDFNVGETSDEDMRKIVSKYHSWGIYLTCIGVGMGNYKDSKLETLAQWGQGNFVYIDNKDEAQRLFDSDNYKKVLMTMATNSRMKVIFNPDIIESYRLIGYETKIGGKTDSSSAYLPGGDINYGQEITAFFELHPQKNFRVEKKGQANNIAATVILQYKTIYDQQDHVIIREIPGNIENFEQSGDDVRFATAVTLFGMLLSQSQYTDKGNYKMVEKILRHIKGDFDKVERKSCLKLVQKVERLSISSVN